MSGWADKFKASATSASSQKPAERPRPRTKAERAAAKVERLAQLRKRRNRETGLLFRERVRRSTPRPGELYVEWPGEVKPAGNAHELPIARHRRVQRERDLARLALEVAELDGFRQVLAEGHGGDFVVLVRLHRLASRRLDDDNLVGAFKGVRDEVAEMLGVDDRSPLIRFFVYDTKAPACSLGVHLRVEEIHAGELRDLDGLRRLAERVTVEAERVRLAVGTVDQPEFAQRLAASKRGGVAR